MHDSTCIWQFTSDDFKSLLLIVLPSKSTAALIPSKDLKGSLLLGQRVLIIQIRSLNVCWLSLVIISMTTNLLPNRVCKG